MFVADKHTDSMIRRARTAEHLDILVAMREMRSERSCEEGSLSGGIVLRVCVDGGDGEIR